MAVLLEWRRLMVLALAVSSVLALWGAPSVQGLRPDTGQAQSCGAALRTRTTLPDGWAQPRAAGPAWRRRLRSEVRILVANVGRQRQPPIADTLRAFLKRHPAAAESVAATLAELMRTGQGAGDEDRGWAFALSAAALYADLGLPPTDAVALAVTPREDMLTKSFALDAVRDRTDSTVAIAAAAALCEIVDRLQGFGRSSDSTIGAATRPLTMSEVSVLLSAGKVLSAQTRMGVHLGFHFRDLVPADNRLVPYLRTEPYW